MPIHNAQWLVDTYWQYDERPIWHMNPYTNIHVIVQKLEALLK
jgi:hypothetical protein